MAPASRRTIYVNQEDAALDEAEISAVITSQNAVPIIAERAMYANVAGQVFGAGHESAGLPAPSAQWFLAEGATGPFFNLFILVANPTATPAPLDVRYLLTDGRIITRRHTAAANSRLTIGVHAEHADLANAAMSAIVTSTTGVPVLVERAMWWPANAPAWYEAHASAGATATGTVWATADGEAGGPSGAETYLLIANTGSYAGSARVTLVFEDGGTASRTVPLLPFSRRNVAVGEDFPEAAGRRFGAIVESLGAQPAPIVVERAIYSNAGGVVWAAGSNLVATPLTARAEVPVIVAPPHQAGGIASPMTVAGILGGDPEAPAHTAIPDVVAESTTPPGEIVTNADGVRLVRTKLDIGFVRAATVAQLNSVLDAIGGRIVNAIAGVTVVTVRIPDPGSLPALEGLAARIRSLPGVTTVAPVLVREEEALPPTTTGSSLGLATIDHLIAARAPAAWNVAAALSQSDQPLLVVEDYFGNGPPNAAVDAGMVTSDFSNDGLRAHGYHVLATILGRFASVPSLGAGPNEVAGLFPRRVDARIVDMQATALPDGTAIENAVLRLVRDLPRRVVLNSSTGLEAPLAVAAITPLAVNWITKVRTAGTDGTSLEGKFLHVKAAGNDSSVLAALASEVGAAALLANLVDGTGAPVSNSTNALLVENVLNTASEPFEPGCRRATSNVGGTIAAVGTAVFSLMDPGSTAGDKNGTSMATPQVAALAIYLWTLAPSLTPPQVMARLRATARPGVAQTDPLCSTIASATAPVIDAYAAVLSADEGLAAPRVRQTLLDVVDTAGAATPDGTFDEHDVQRFLDELDTRTGATFDYSRFDLNGDGRTGGATRSRFDLDANVLPAWSSVTLEVEGVSVAFDEARLTDLEILCYYAYSSVYDGDDDARGSILQSACLPPIVTVTPSTVTLEPTATQQFSATVAGVPDQSVTWSATAGTIAATGLFTAPATAATVTVTVRATSVADPRAFGEAIVTVDGRAQSNARLVIGQSDMPVGHIRAFVDLTGFTLMRPLSERDAVIAAFNEELTRVRVGTLTFFVGEPVAFTYAYTATDLGGVQISAQNGAVVDVTVGNVRPDPTDPGLFGSGRLYLVGLDGTVRMQAGAVEQIDVDGSRGSITAGVLSARGVRVGSAIGSPGLTVDLTVGAVHHGAVQRVGQRGGPFPRRRPSARRPAEAPDLLPEQQHHAAGRHSAGRRHDRQEYPAPGAESGGYQHHRRQPRDHRESRLQRRRCHGLGLPAVGRREPDGLGEPAMTVTLPSRRPSRHHFRRCPWPPSRRESHARATVQSRFTVAGATPSTAAVSSMVSPAK